MVSQTLQNSIQFWLIFFFLIKLDTNNIEDEIANKKLEEDNVKNIRREFYAKLVENENASQNATSQAFIHLNKNKLTFYIQTESVEKPTFVRFQDLEDTIIEEYIVFGNSSYSTQHHQVSHSMLSSKTKAMLYVP